MNQFGHNLKKLGFGHCSLFSVHPTEGKKWNENEEIQNSKCVTVRVQCAQGTVVSENTTEKTE